jgi:hypothetical protein
MHETLIEFLKHSTNLAADDLLMEGLRLGSEAEQSLILEALLARKTVYGLSGVIEQFEKLPPRLQSAILGQIKIVYHAIAECGRNERPELRIAAMKLIALSKQGRLTYVLLDNLHSQDEAIGRVAVDAIVSLSQWVSSSVRKLQDEYIPSASDAEAQAQAVSSEPGLPALYRQIIEQRGELEAAVARGLDLHRGKFVQDLVRAALLLADWPQSKTLAILQTAKHGGQSALVRRLQQAPTAENVESFLLGATHGQLRLHFGTVFAYIGEVAVLNALLRKTHWLRDQQLQHCMHQVTRGVWWQEIDLLHDIENRPAMEGAKIAEWLAASGMNDVTQDERFIRLADHARQDFGARLSLLRTAARRKKGTSALFFRDLIGDSDDRIARMATRELVRRQPADYENTLLQLMTNAPPSVRRIISRAIGHSGFEQFWDRFDRMDRPMRKQAGKAMLKLLPDAIARLSARLSAGPVEQRLKAMQIVQELDLAPQMQEVLAALLRHPDPKVRSKAVTVVGELPQEISAVLVQQAMEDTDGRVRANAIEAMEQNITPQMIPMLSKRLRSPHSRERANALKALNSMRLVDVGPQMISMLRDERPEHRISAMWAMRQMGMWKLLDEIGKRAKEDPNLRVRRYALTLLKGVAELVENVKNMVG